MTKRRNALTCERALWTVAGKIGWPAIVELTGKSESAVRNWGDEDTSAGIRLDAALKLDAAYQAAGGDAAPFLHWYQTRLAVELRAASADRVKLSVQIARAAKEGGEALHAATMASLPNASPSELARAELELEQSIDAQKSALAQVRALRVGAPEVAPPAANVVTDSG